MKIDARLLPVLLLFALTACKSQTEVDVDEVIEEKVEERLEEYRTVFFDRCRNEALEEAGRLADSIILDRARRMRDTSGRPARPRRPDTPHLQRLQDSLLHPRPLFDTIG